MNDLRDKIQELTQLPIGWDGYRGQPVHEDNAYEARKILTAFMLSSRKLPDPSVVPGSDGSIQLEWHTEGVSIELKIDLHGESDASYSMEIGIGTYADEYPSLFANLIQNILHYTQPGYPKKLRELCDGNQ